MSTENKLTREEVIHVFHLYYNTDAVALGATFSKKDFIGKVDSVMNHIISLKYEDEGEYRRGLMWPVEGCRLLLTPINRVSNDHLAIIGKLHMQKVGLEFTPKDHTFYEAEGVAIIDHFTRGKLYNSAIVINQFLIDNGYAVPLWFGIDHWANGQTAIALNIAKDVTEK